MNNYTKRKAIHTLRVNIKSLSYESRIIREEIQKARDPDIKNSLYLHKIRNVREESRTTQLAMAAIKGIPYCQIEKYARQAPDWKRILTKCNKHATSMVNSCILRWTEDGQKYFQENILTK